MKSKTRKTQSDSKEESSHSEELKNQVFEMAYVLLGRFRSRLSMKHLREMKFCYVIADLQNVVEILKPFNQLDQSDILSDNKTVAKIRAHYYKYAMGGQSDCEIFLNDGRDKGTPEHLVNLMILEACSNFVLTEIFKIKWGLIRQMLFGGKLEYIRARYQFISEFMKTIH